MQNVSGKKLKADKVIDLPAKPVLTPLRHGQVIWLLTELGYGLGTNKGALHEYLKALRKLGIPFGRVIFQGGGHRRLAEYTYCHIMEVVIVMSLRVYHVIPDAVLNQMIRYRRRLSRMYIRAYELRHSGAGAPVTLRSPNGVAIEFRGMFLDLDIRFSGGRLSHFRPPRLLTSFEALDVFSKASLPGRVFLPMNLSMLAERVMGLALAATIAQGGPTPRRRRVAL
jgi:hypothetical protein